MARPCPWGFNGSAFRAFREIRGYSIIEFARLVGAQPAAILRWGYPPEHPKALEPSFPQGMLCANILGCAPESFIDMPTDAAPRRIRSRTRDLELDRERMSKGKKRGPKPKHSD